MHDRYAARLNGLTSVAFTRLDVLDSLPSIQVCTAYRLDGETTTVFPAATPTVSRCRPVYEELAGWQQETSGVRRFEDLPPAAKAYVQRIQELIGCRIDLVSVGPERDQAIVINPII